jgi:hypothetical protein
MISTRHARRIVFYVLLAIPLAYILGASYVGLNGGHVWRQADVFVHILGFAGKKGFVPFEDFVGQRSVYDIPIYQYLIAKLSLLIRADPLVVTRYFNALLWLLTAYSGWRIVEKFREHSGTIFLFVIATSPLLLHYFSAPMPDIMALAFSMLALSLLLKGQLGPKDVALISTLLGIAALIKSPVPFVVLIFYATWLGAGVLVRREEALLRVRSHWHYVSIPLLTALVCAVLAEGLRNQILGQELVRFAQDPAWYFGTLEIRFSAELWRIALERFLDASTRYLGGVYIGLLLLAIHPALKMDRTVVLAAIIANLSAWLVFPVLYKLHDYYQLPGTLLTYTVVAMAARSVWNLVTEKMPPLAFGHTRRLQYEHFLLVGLVCYAVAATVAMQEISEFRRTSVYDALEYALRDKERFLYVVDDKKFNDNFGPIIGGRLVTRFAQMNHGEFERDCDRLMNKFHAVLVEGTSMCLSRQKNRASFYLESDGYEFLLVEERREP